MLGFEFTIFSLFSFFSFLCWFFLGFLWVNFFLEFYFYLFIFLVYLFCTLFFFVVAAGITLHYITYHCPLVLSFHWCKLSMENLPPLMSLYILLFMIVLNISSRPRVLTAKRSGTYRLHGGVGRSSMVDDHVNQCWDLVLCCKGNGNFWEVLIWGYG